MKLRLGNLNEFREKDSKWMSTSILPLSRKFCVNSFAIDYSNLTVNFVFCVSKKIKYKQNFPKIYAGTLRFRLTAKI